MTGHLVASLSALVAMNLSTSNVPRPGPVLQELPLAPKVRLVEPRREKFLRGLLPEVEDTGVQTMLEHPSLILYTEAEMPRAYQNWRGDLQGVHAASYNISANGSEPFGNGNREFPWSAPGGTHRAEHVSTFRFLWLPQDERGKLLPVVWFRQRLRGDSSVGYAWRFPVGAVVGEVLLVQSPQGRHYPFSLRLRIREQGDWAVDVFRPFPRSKDLSARIKQLRPDWEQQPALARLVGHLDTPRRLAKKRLRDRQPGATVFSQWMGVDVLPALEDDRLVAELLSETKFKSALGERWYEDDRGVYTAAPTTEARFHVVPAKFDGGFLEVNRTSCIRCHDTVNQNVNRFNFSRDWYGRIRGSDGIFSFHPFSLASISHNGFGRRVRMRRELVDAGALEHFDPKKHPRSIYNQVPHLEE